MEEEKTRVVVRIFLIKGHQNFPSCFLLALEEIRNAEKISVRKSQEKINTWEN
jgi:hypothetical protein